ncbi:MAG: MFS transporter [Spirochaetes bacterium]|nr:MFS transporter [Spirochaetota bacterium]
MTNDPLHRGATLFGVALIMFLGALDQTIVSTALPRIVADLGGMERYGWVFSTYILVSTLVVPIYGKLADIFDKKRLMLFATLTFLGGSALCGMAGEWGTLPLLGDGMGQLVAFRGLQGLGGGGLFTLAFIVISDLYPPRERSKIGGVFGAIFGLASVLGPLFGGLLTDHAGGLLAGVEGWRWVFYVNLPIGVVALWFLIARMPHLAPLDPSHAFNFVSAFLMVASFFPLVLALQLDKNAHPWGSPRVLALLGGSLVALTAWVWHSLKVAKHPVLDLSLFRNHVFTLGNIATFFFGAGFLSLIIFLPLYMVQIQGVSATRAGVSIIPLTVGVIFGASLGGPLASKLGRYKAILAIGSVVALVAAALLLGLGIDTPMGVVIAIMVVAGIGLGPAQSLYSIAVQNSVPPAEIGQATSFNQFSRQIGSTVAAAVLGAVFSASLTLALEKNMPPSPTHQAARSSVSGQTTSKGPQEIRAAVEAKIDRQIAGIDERLKALRASAPSAQAIAELEGARKRLEVVKAETIDRMVLGVKRSFAEAIHRVFAGVLIIMALLALFTFLLPSLPLRGRPQGGEGPGH